MSVKITQSEGRGTGRHHKLGDTDCSLEPKPTALWSQTLETRSCSMKNIWKKNSCSKALPFLADVCCFFCSGAKVNLWK